MQFGNDISVNFENFSLVHQCVSGKRHLNVPHVEAILFIPLQGEMSIEISGEYFKVRPGHMLFLPGHAVHAFGSSIFLGERLIAMIGSKNDTTQALNKFDPSILPLSRLIKEILHYLLLHPQTPHSKSSVSVIIETLEEILNGTRVLYTSSTEYPEGKIRDGRVRKAIMFVKKNFNEKISIRQIAKQAGLSSRSLNRLMLLETGMTPKKFLMSVRIEKAKNILQRPDASVTSVAFEVGYNSLSHFIDAFRAETGKLPSEFKRIGRKPKI